MVTNGNNNINMRTMKKVYTLGLMAIIAIYGCQKTTTIVPIDVDKSEPKVFTATILDNTSAETKTILDNNGNVLWKMGDQISIFAGMNTNSRYQVTDASDGKTEAALEEVGGTGGSTGGNAAGGARPIDHNVAYYPYSAAAAINRTEPYTIQGVNLPAEQSYVASSFASGCFPMVAICPKADNNLKFKNLLGGVKLQLKGTAAIASISITGNRDESLCGSNGTVTVPASGDPSISLPSTATKIVTLNCGTGVQLDANTATAFIIALPPMTMDDGFTVVVTDTDGDSMEIKTTKTQTINRSKLLKMPAVTYKKPFVPEYVDLGLPSGLKWATCNLGATAPEEYGDYFAWGETEPYYSSLTPLTWKAGKTDHTDWTSYKWCQGSKKTLTKYNTVDSYGPVVDNIVTLEMADDAARANWGDNWRMPTKEEFKELFDNCTKAELYTTINGFTGLMFTSNHNGKSIFFPAAGRLSSVLFDVGDYGYYWSSSLANQEGRPDMANFVNIRLTVSAGVDNRYYGFSIRPVKE